MAMLVSGRVVFWMNDEPPFLGGGWESEGNEKKGPWLLIGYMSGMKYYPLMWGL